MSETEAKRSLGQRLRQPFVTGVISFLPLALTVAAVAWVVLLLHDLVGPSSAFGRMLGSFGLNFVACEVIAYFAGALGALALIYSLGLVVESGLGRRYQVAVEGAVQQLPLVSTVYDASKNLTSMFDPKNEDVKAMTPVLCSFGGEGGTASIALMPTPSTIRIDGRDYHVVIVPTAPVPFGGALLCVPAEYVKPAGCSFDELVKIFMSMGVSAPDYLGKRDAE